MHFAAANLLCAPARRGLWTFVCSAALCLGLAGSPGAVENHPFAGMAVTVVKSRAACFDDSLKLNGFIVAREEAFVRPETEGYHVAKVLAEDGEAVTAGQKLLELAKPEWLPQSLPATATITANSTGTLVVPRPIPIGMPVSSRADPLFRIIRNGEFDLELDASQDALGKIKPGQSVRIEILGADDIAGIVRNLAPDVDYLSQLGHARVEITGKPNIRAGTFAMATIDIGKRCNTSVPLSAVLFDRGGPVVQVVQDGRIETRAVQIGLFAGQDIEIREGLKAGEVVVARAGTFLRANDPVRPLMVEARDNSR